MTDKVNTSHADATEMVKHGNAIPLIYSLTLDSAKTLALTGTYNSPHGLETQPMSLTEVEGCVETLMAETPLRAQRIFYYRDEDANPRVLLARKVVGDIEICTLCPDDPQLLVILGVTRQ